MYITITADTDNTIIADINPVKVQRRIIRIYPVLILGPVLEDYYLEIASYNMLKIKKDNSLHEYLIYYNIETG